MEHSSATLMIRWLTLLTLFGAGCSDAQSAKTAERTRLSGHAEIRCRESIETSLAPGSFDYGVVTDSAVARQIASTYFRAIFAGTDVPVEAVLKRPLQAELRTGVWKVSTQLPKDAIGTELFVEFCQSNGKVLALSGSQ